MRTVYMYTYECISVDMVLFACHKVSDVCNFPGNIPIRPGCCRTVAHTSHRMQGTFPVCVYS